MPRADAGGAAGNLRGAGFMVLAMAGFALEDMFLKSAAGHMPVGQVLALFGAFGTLGFLLMARLRGEPLLVPEMTGCGMLRRAVFESGARLFYLLAIALMPLTNASAILQATPLVVVAGAALVFGERVGFARWAAIWAGFAGVLLILRPGTEGFDRAAVFAVLGTLGFAARDLATRAAPRGLSTAQIGICGLSVLVPTGLAVLAITGGAVLPQPAGLALVGAGSLIGVAAYAFLTAAMRTGEVSVVTPFRYTRLLFGVMLGMLVFAERPDAATLAGSAIVLAAGLYILLTRRRPAG
ncbi:DMT family transporter [Tropicimonas sp.]|uniref:DMT family transporter n=1 Tax=Tropicimonas sp. TaxID=2067044 RepID=UPI003A83EFC9